MPTAERRRQIAEVIDGYDGEIKSLNEGKADTWASYREELLAEGSTAADVKAEAAALKAAILKRRKLAARPAEVEESDRLVEEIVTELLAPRPSRARTHEGHGDETGEVEDGAEPTVSLNGKGAMPLGQFVKIANALESPVGLAIAAGFIAGVKLDQERQAESAPAPAPPDETEWAAAIRHARSVHCDKPYRVTDPAPVPVEPDPGAPLLIADAVARQAAARELLGQAEAAE